MAQLEHANFTVPDARKTADWMKEVFGWHIRWEGPAMNGLGTTIHVGTDTSYLALFSFNSGTKPKIDPDFSSGGFNHVGITVDDLEATEARVKAAGFETHSHADYEPGRRFYFYDHDGIEYEVVHYPA